MARVLERLHTAGLLHRDVKPSNVGFSEDGEPKLLDFGLVQILGDVIPARPHAFDVADRGDRLRGHAPLHVAGGARRTPAGSGLRSLGLMVVTFEALTGRHPFERSSASATLAAIRRGWTDELAQLPALPRSRPLRDLFESALAAEPRRRPETAAELAERLRATADALIGPSALPQRLPA